MAKRMTADIRKNGMRALEVTDRIFGPIGDRESVRGEDYSHDFLPPRAHDTAEAREAARTEMARLRAEVTVLRAKLDEADAERASALDTQRREHQREVDALHDIINTHQREQRDSFDAGLQQGQRTQRLPSIIAR